jgi:CelD/BcsL family acetyltransferase involved in cellulose biosynthesis
VLTAELVDEAAAARNAAAPWDALAVATSQPYCAPAWMLAWWRHVAPPGAQLRLVLVRDGGELVGVAPCFVDRGVDGLVRGRILGARTSSRVDLLAVPGREAAVAAHVIDALLATTPAPHVLLFESTRKASPWPELLTAAWSERGRVRQRRRFVLDAPIVDVANRSYDEWFAARSAHFRQHTRRALRQLDAMGARTRLSTPGEQLSRDVQQFAALHRRRWQARGGSGVLDRGVEAMLADAADELVPPGRLWVWSLDVGEQTISSHVFLTAGDEVAYWLGGFHPEWARWQPAIVTIVRAIEHAFATGARRMDLGSGSHPYKLRLSDGVDPLAWTVVAPSGPRAALACGELRPLQARLAVAGALPPSAKRWARRVAAGVSSVRGVDADG